MHVPEITRQRKAAGRRAWRHRRRKDPRSTARWQKLRAWKLRRNPLCEPCLREGFETLATEVDHIRPMIEAPDLIFEPSNLQSICKPCHAKKSARERDA